MSALSLAASLLQVLSASNGPFPILNGGFNLNTGWNVEFGSALVEIPGCGGALCFNSGKGVFLSAEPGTRGVALKGGYGVTSLITVFAVQPGVRLRWDEKDGDAVGVGFDVRLGMMMGNVKLGIWNLSDPDFNVGWAVGL